MRPSSFAQGGAQQRPPRGLVAHSSSKAGQAVHPTKDATAAILQSVLSAGVAHRLRAHRSISVDVLSNAASLMEGVFGGMSIRGQHWETPLSLTAQSIEVDVGPLLLDYGALVTQSSVALRNLPTGSCKLRLSSSDLANFMSHPILHPVSATAVQGKAFDWDRSAVDFGRDASGAFFVDFEGIWEDARYRVRMIPPGASTGGALRVSARCLSCRLQRSSDDDSRSPAAGASDVARTSDGSAAVAQGLAHLFTSLQLNLQGIELSRPCLTIHHEGPAMTLEISMKMRIRAIPPLNMQF